MYKTCTLVILLSLVMVCSSSAMAVTFGTSNDGDGGFTPSTATGTEAWNVTTDSYRYSFGELGVDEGHVASLLKSHTLDRSDGAAYTIEGVVDLTAGYGDDNNRIGILLFNDSAEQTADGGGLYLRLNTDSADDSLNILGGINGTTLSNEGETGVSGAFSGDGWIGTTLTFTADIAFTGANIDVTYTFTDQDGVQDTLTAQVLAADYTGTYFGFATKWRQRGDDTANRNVPPVMDYQSFNVVPEPASMALLSLGGLALLRRRRS